MRGDGLSVEREEKVQREKNSQHGPRHLLFKKTTKSLDSHNAITYNTCAIAAHNIRGGINIY
jgi:hypothetical protein